MAGNIEYFEKPSDTSVNKINVSFLKKVTDLFAGITYILYLWSVVRNVERYKFYMIIGFELC